MRTFIFLLLFINLFGISTAHNSVNNSFVFSSEESNKITSSEKSIEPKKQKINKEPKKIIRQKNKEVRKEFFKVIKENKKLYKQKSKQKVKNTSKKIHWAAYLSFFGTLVALGIIVAGLILKYAVFNVLFPIAIGLLIVSFIASIIGISVVANKEMTLYHKSKTITLALIGGIISLLSLLFIGFIIIALSNITI